MAVEPSPDFHQALTANTQANGCGHVRTVNAAVSDSQGRMTFYLEHRRARLLWGYADFGV
ncbi:hypothetical protein ACWEKM_21020 [Streptomyces sp. NPDC004752]